MGAHLRGSIPGEFNRMHWLPIHSCIMIMLLQNNEKTSVLNQINNVRDRGKILLIYVFQVEISYKVAKNFGLANSHDRDIQNAFQDN